MIDGIENLKIEDVYTGVSKKSWTVTCRKGSSFIFRLSGGVCYHFADKSITVNAGEFIFLPHGSTYDATLIGAESEFIAIRIQADLTVYQLKSYPTDGFLDAEELTSSIADLWRHGGKSEQYRCYSLVYSVLAYVSGLENMEYTDKKRLAIIKPAVEYLKEHVYDVSLSTQTLHGLCGISGTYFRRIFESAYGVSPQRYILRRRLSHAKSILGSGDFDSISSVAAAVGYSDPLYFSRAFKKEYGVSPSEYAKS